MFVENTRMLSISVLLINFVKYIIIFKRNRLKSMSQLTHLNEL